MKRERRFVKRQHVRGDCEKKTVKAQKKLWVSSEGRSVKKFIIRSQGK